MVIEVPEEFKPVGEAVKEFIRSLELTRGGMSGGRAVDYLSVGREVSERGAAIERAGHGILLRALDIDAERVVIRGEQYARVGREPATFYTMAGPVEVTRSLYRRAGHRNEKTVDAVSLRAGVLEGGWLPDTAQAMSRYVQEMPSRAAEKAAQQAGRLPYCRSSFERVAHMVGSLYGTLQADIEEALIETFEIPKAAASLSVGLDRVSVPMEEPRPRPVGRPKKDAPKNPVVRKYRMAFVGTLTVHDAEGKSLGCLRNGRMPQGDAKGLVAGLAADAAALLAKRPDLKMAALVDGAPEMHNLLVPALKSATGVEVHDLVDFWHLIEKLGEAAAVIYGDDKGGVVQRWKLALLNRQGAVWSILEELKQSGCEHKPVGEERPVHGAITYLTNSGARMNYAAARKAGLPIGSGNTEATCKSLFDIRFKRSGSRWLDETGENIVRLRALALSDRWEDGTAMALRELRAAVRLAA
jgi:hypothetical protein